MRARCVAQEIGVLVAASIMGGKYREPYGFSHPLSYVNNYLDLGSRAFGSLWISGSWNSFETASGRRFGVKRLLAEVLRHYRRRLWRFQTRFAKVLISDGVIRSGNRAGLRIQTISFRQLSTITFIGPTDPPPEPSTSLPVGLAPV